MLQSNYQSKAITLEPQSDNSFRARVGGRGYQYCPGVAVADQGITTWEPPLPFGSNWENKWFKVKLLFRKPQIVGVCSEPLH